MAKIELSNIKTALRDGRFRDTLPIDFQPDVAKFLQNPGCNCNIPLYRRILKECKKQLADYFPNSEITGDEINSIPDNQWTVINCHIDELEDRLRKLPPGQKQLGISRWEDQVTVIVNESV